MSKNSFEDVVKEALIENTAQDIFNYLNEIESKREIYEKHWIWELLQNALDAVPEDQKIEVEIIKNDNQLIFRHNGRRFESREIAHLICHGSTKKAQDIGKFGVGFLTTHLLSRKVKIKGVDKDNKKFEFVLNREGNSSDEIKQLMKQTLKEYESSFKEEDTNYTAEYSYPLTNISLNTVVVGLRELTKIAPYVLAFNDELGAIKITDQARKLEFELANENNETTYIKKVVKEEEYGKTPILHELWIVKDEEIEIAIKGKKHGDETCQIESLQSIPKIFIGFPLFGTQDLPFPVVVNSRKFEPMKERNGIFLGKGDTNYIKRNKRLLVNASDLFIKKLISAPDSDRWENIHTLLNLNIPPDKDWLDKDWYIDLLKKLISEIMNMRVFRTENGSLIPFTGAFILAMDPLEKEKLEKLWNLCYCFSTYKDKIPAKGLIIEWAEISYGWKSLGLDLTKREITIEKLAEEIVVLEKLPNFQTQLSSDKDALRFLNDFYNIILNANKQTLFDRNILPNQNGIFMNRTTLFKDEGIHESLKEIYKKLGEDVKEVLLHLEIGENVNILLQKKKQEEILTQIVSKIKQPCPNDDQYVQANLELFKWLMENDKFDSFEGYPFLSCKEKIYTSAGKENKEKLLAPKEIWNDSARIHASLFPQELIISSIYHEKISQKDKWDKLENKGLILTDPVYKGKEKLSREDFESLLLSGEKLEEKKEHEVADDVVVSKIAFLETKDKGIIDTIRKSKDKARKFLDFLFKYVIEEDSQWDNSLEVTCTCGTKHKIYPAFWLATLKNRLWVPDSVHKGKSEKPSAQYLALLLEDHRELLQTCRQDKPSRLLSILNVSISELMMRVVAKDDKIKLELDKAMGSLCSTFMTNPSQLSKIAQIAESEAELFVKEIEKRIQIREQIRRNQSVGSSVENLLKNVLEKEGFKVERTGTGSDFVIEHDFIIDNMETIFEVQKEEKLCYYIEVKATSQDFARMTLTQAKEARDKSDKYILCVVKLDGLELEEENIKNVVKFVIDIGQKIQDKVGKAENLKDEQEKIAVRGDIEIEISEGPIRFKINKRVWEHSKTFEQFLEFIRGTKI